MKVAKMSAQEESIFVLDFLESSQQEIQKSYHDNLDQAMEDFAENFFQTLAQVSPENKQIVMKSITINQKFREIGVENDCSD